jgi:acyl-CoA synthetase (AMP-forming)/AMP-acid ligase II
MKMNFSRVMRALALRHKDREAIVNVERQRRYSYWDYHLLTNRIANALRETLKVGVGDKFLLILENDNLSLMMGPTVLKQEGTVVLTNLRDSVEEHRWQVELVKPRVVFLENRLLDGYYEWLRTLGCEIVVMDPLIDLREGVHVFWDLVAAVPDADTGAELDTLEHTFMLRFTGGTTGRGKCAMYSIDNVLACRDGTLANPALNFDERTRLLHVAPLSHGSQIFYYTTIFVGGANVTLNQLDLEGWREVVEQEAVSHSFLVPTILYRLLELQRAKPRDLSSLRTIIYGAAPMSPSKLGELIGCFGSIFAQAYAATEVITPIAVLDKGEHRYDEPQAIRRLASAGRIMPGVEVCVVDENGRELAAGKVGEIRIRSRGVIQGYYLNPEGTASEFVGGAWKSGDLGYFDDDGYLYIVDRIKDMIITGGFNVYAVEVEAALSSHPAVLQSTVVGVPHPEWGEAVHAEVVLRAGGQASDQELITHVKERIGGHKAPKAVSFVDCLPTSVVGKVLRRQVKEKYWQGAQRKVS